SYVRLVPAPSAPPGGPDPSADVRFGPANLHSGLDLGYSRLIGFLRQGRWSTLCTNEGGVLPAALVRLHRRLLDPATTEETVRLAACGWLYDPGAGWSAVPGALPRIRLASALDLAASPDDPALSGAAADAGKAELLCEVSQRQEIAARAER